MKNDNVSSRYPLNLQLFAEGDPEPAPEPKPEPEPKDDTPKAFTQEEIDKIVAERIARERKKFADYDELKTKLSTFEQAEEERRKAEMSEKERLEAEKADALKKAEEAEGKAQSALEAANNRLIRSEFMVLARSSEFNIRPDALDDAFVLADLSAVRVDEDGNVTGIKEALKVLKDNKPYLEDQPKREPKTIGEPSKHPAGDDIRTMEEQLEEAKKKRDFSKVIELSNKIKAMVK